MLTEMLIELDVPEYRAESFEAGCREAAIEIEDRVPLAGSRFYYLKIAKAEALAALVPLFFGGRP